MNQAMINRRKKHIDFVFDEYNRIRHKNYRMVKQLGGISGCGVVFEVEDIITGERIAMKAIDTAIAEISCSNKEMIKYTNAEIKAMKECRDCPYIIDIIDAFDYIIDDATDEHVFLIFMPMLMESADYIESKGFDKQVIIKMTKDICKALDYCHSKKILHRDVKPGNIFYSPDKGCFVLADFGVSRALLDNSFAVTPIGSYLAPEIYFHRNLQGRFNSDIYSLGITTLLLLGGKGNIFANIKDNLQNLKPERLRIVLQKAIAADPAVRYQTAKEFFSELNAVDWAEKKPVPKTTDADEGVKAIFADKWSYAESLAKRGHEAGNTVMSCLYAYILNCKDDSKAALDILMPLKNKGNNVAKGLYGIIGFKAAKNSRNDIEAKRCLNYLEESAKKGFSAAQYIIGRWYIDGQAGLKSNIELGLDYIFKSGKQSFRPAMYYLRDVLMRKDNEIESAQSMIDLLEIQLEGYTEDKFSIDMLVAVSVSG